MFIVIEGLDGAGKSTQVKKIIEYFTSKGKKCEYVHFPRFTAPIYGDLIASFLRGDLGAIDTVDPKLVALIYAGDRAEAKEMINRWIEEDKVVIVDRYVYSNVAYQCAKSSVADDLKEWIINLEYNHNSLPKPNLTLFLDVPLEFTKAKLEEQREGEEREYLKGKKDIHEASISFQERVQEVYIKLIKQDNLFKIVKCSDNNEKIKTPNEIFELIREQIQMAQK